MTIKNLFPTSRPTLNLNFAKTKRLDPRITFSRSSTATYIGSNGLIKSAAINEARFDHSPSTGESLGLLVEEARTNLLVQSEGFGTTWTTSPGTISANVTTAPDGTITADKLVTSNTTAQQRTLQNATVSAGTLTFSVYAKAAGFSYMRLESGASVEIANFDLTQGVLGTVSGAATITRLNNGWYRCSMPITASTGTTDFRIYVIGSATDARGSTLAGNGTDGIFLWGAQLETGSFPTSYIPTTTTTVTRAADLASMTGTNFSSWWNPNAGSIIMGIRHSIPDNGMSYVPLLLKGGTTYDRLEVYVDNSGIAVSALRGLQYENNVSYPFSWSLDNTINALPNTNVRFGMALSPSSWAFSANTGSLKTGSSILLPIGGQIWMMRDIFGNPMTGTIARLTYYPTRLSDATLQALTAS